MASREAAFHSALVVDELDDRHARLRFALRYQSALPAWALMIVVPGGFITDFSSVPRWLPFTYALYGGRAKKAAVLHDYGYARQTHRRREVDALFLEAMHVTGLGWRAWAMWLGVRLCGGAAWRQDGRWGSRGV